MTEATHPVPPPEHHASAHGHAAHGMAHVMSIPLLVGVFLALVFLTGVTVWATVIDLGANANLLVAMLIATVKAALVCVFFMHLLYDRGFHSVVFLSSLVFVLLFVTFSMMDSFEYRPAVDAFRDVQSATSP